MKLFLAYCKQKQAILLLLLLFFAVFFAAFALYRLPLEAVLYPGAICAILGVGYLLLDFCRASQKHRDIMRLQAFSNICSESLPKCEGIDDCDYQSVLTLLAEEERMRAERANTQYQNMVDYYTVWAHQIKTPIASMRLHLQNEDSALSRQLSAELFRIEQYVEMVLMFLRLDSDTTDYVITSCDLDGIVRESVKKFAAEFIGRKLRLVYEPLERAVLTDEKWLSFVIEQVLSNALKYTQKGCVTINWQAPCTLCIRDTGMGIAPEDLPRIFEKGYTGYHGRSDKKASGIGLYLCRRICGNLGHTITAESELGCGTVIRIDLSERRVHPE